jgi:hypothetical protein
MLEKSGFIRPHVSLAVYVFFFLVGLGFELSASHLQSRWSTTWATALVHFALVIFEDGVSWTICLGQPQTKILLISASQVASITSMSHWCPPSLIDWWSFWDRLLLFLRTDVSFAVIYLFIYFETESSDLFAQTDFKPQSFWSLPPQVAKITDMSHQYPAAFVFWCAFIPFWLRSGRNEPSLPSRSQ